MRTKFAGLALSWLSTSLFLGLVCANIALAQSASSTALGESSVDAASARVLAASKQASGGVAWDQIRTTHETSTVKADGLKGTDEEWDDLLTGRTAQIDNGGPATWSSGYDGTSGWVQDEFGDVRIVTGDDDVKRQIDQAYLTCNAFWYPERLASTIVYLKTATERARKFDVLSVTPVGGSNFQLWFDQSTRLLDRIVMPEPNSTVNTYFSDYRKVAGTLQPFQVRVTDDRSPGESDFQLQDLEVNVDVPDLRFAVPKPAPMAFDMSAGATSVTVPFTLTNEHICFDATIDGNKLTAALDSGASLLIDPATAKQVHLKSVGNLSIGGFGPNTSSGGLGRVQDLQIGGLTLHNALFNEVDSSALHGMVILGSPIFFAFVVNIDFDRSLLTFTRPDSFTYTKQTLPTPFEFNGITPMVDGTLDGISGKVTIDTGSSGSLELTTPFVAANRLNDKYHPAFTEAGFGIGGTTREGIARAKSVTLGAASVQNVIIELSTDKAGAGADKTIAGNIGIGVLHHFNLTFDYPHKQIYFEPNVMHDTRDVFSTDGMILKRAAGKIYVYATIPGGAAHLAGIQPFDVILAVNGANLNQSNLDVLGKALAQPEGTAIQLQVQTGAKIHTVTLTLKDVV